MMTDIRPPGILLASSPATTLVQKPKTSAGKKAARNLMWSDQAARIASITIGGTTIPTRNGAVSRNKSIVFGLLSVGNLLKHQPAHSKSCLLGVTIFFRVKPTSGRRMASQTGSRRCVENVQHLKKGLRNTFCIARRKNVTHGNSSLI